MAGSSPDTSFGQDLAEDARTVGHDPVDTEIEETMHLVGLIDGPDVDVQVEVVRPLDESTVHQGDATGAHRDLHTAAAGMTTAEAETGGPESGDCLRSQRGAQRRTQKLLETVDPAVGERADAHPLGRTEPTEQFGEGFDDSVMLRIDVDPEIRPGGQQLLEQRDRFPSVDEGQAHLAPGEILDHPLPIGDPIEAIVMEGQHLTIGGEMRIGLDIAIPQSHRPGEGRHGVLGPVSGAAAVGEGDGTAVVEEGMGAGHDATVDARGPVPAPWDRRTRDLRRPVVRRRV